ncbi:LLM class flavin-dependent oxidoreductase [Kutzneria viridogrisea]|uniref:Luciferase family oxidoreductase group 1 n=1 Tax=Kutzneria viridogrisea TaxID=47990 RepID=A0ABR6BNY9_9PSEU|nr:luciferase family oxidoreductase group 1 [Kutzneria viridogrisea]
MTGPLPADVPLSVLDLAPVPEGSTSTQALRNTLDLARHVEDWGYHRFWLAEHHNMPGIASSAPAVLIGHVAAATATLRVGSGGVMLPNHPPLVVAEQFGTLEALHPGRIDLGIGRAPGTDGATAQALRRTAGPLSADDFPQQLGELLNYFEQPEPGQRIIAVNAPGNKPPLWLLGSSGYSAQVAGMLGIPFAFAHHFSAENTLPALALYRQTFRPSAVLDKPYAMVAASAVIADTDEQARWHAGPSGLSFLRLRSGKPGLLPTPEEAAEYPYTDLERAFIEDRFGTTILGSPATARAQLADLLERTQADELMVTTMVHDHAARLHSYELLATLFRESRSEAGESRPAVAESR